MLLQNNKTPIVLLILIVLGVFALNESPESNFKLILTNRLNSELDIGFKLLDKIENDLRSGQDSKNIETRNFDLFIYDKSRLDFWSTDDYEFDSKTIFLNTKGSFIVDNEFGKFIALKGSSLSNTIILSLPIERRYPVTNQYVSSYTNKKIFKDLDVQFLKEEKDKSVVLTLNNGLKLSLNVENSYVNEILMWSYLMFLVFSISIILWKINRSDNVYFNIILIVILRVVLLFFTPSVESNLLFLPSIFASSFVQPNLFQLLLNIVLVFAIYKQLLKLHFIKRYLSIVQYLFIFINFIIINDLVKHSVLDLSPYNLVNLDIESLFLIVTFLLVVGILKLSLSKVYTSSLKIDLVFIAASSLLMYYLQDELVYFYLSGCFVVLLSSNYFFDNQRFILLSIAVSLLFAYQISTKKINNDNMNQRNLVNKIVSGSDPYIEYLINDVSERIANDKIIISKLKSPFYGTNQFVEDKLRKVYLEKYFQGYDFNIDIVSIDRIFRENEKLVLNESEFNVYKKSYVDLYQIKGNEVGENDYIKIVCFNDDYLVRNVAITFKGKANSEYSILPKLLVNEDDLVDQNTTYNYLLLTDNKVSAKNGIFNSISSRQLIDKYQNDKLKGFLQKYSVVTYKFKNKVLIITQDDLFFTYFINAWSLVIILILIVLILNTLYQNLYKGEWKSLVYRLQITFSVVVVMSFVFILLAIINSISNDYEDNIEKENLKKSELISEEVERILISNNRNKNSIDNELERLSKVNNTDINLYNSNGKLIISTLPQLYEKHYKSNNVKIGVLDIFSPVLTNDKIGNLAYKSAVSPIINDNEDRLGYITIPFFNSEDKLKTRIDEVSYSVLKTAIIFLFVILIVTYFLSKNISYPLVKLTHKLDSLSLENDNEPIKWQNNDEIGKLVKTYNRLLFKLKESKERLQMKEKQEAWKEMAQQVAHEIKNPLTPMKLSLQFLQRKAQSEEISSKEIEQTTSTLITQIDNLTEIVSSFSEFATMPDYKRERENITEIVKEVSQLYVETADIKIEIEENLYSEIDKKAFSGIISNLIINGIQSVEIENNASINLVLKKVESTILISISDNGIGISDDIKDKVFIPNFSTKYTGSGIGLALAKQGIEEFRGRIWFETKLNVGTTFYIELPLSE